MDLAPPPPLNAPVVEDMEKRTQQFIEVRDRIKELDDKHAELMKPLRKIQEQLAGRIQAFMASNNLENLKTKSGTCYTTHRTTASLADPEAFMKYVIEHGQFDLLDRRANSTAVKDFVQRNKALPPGCNLNTIETVGVRRAGSTGADKE
jgi:hypothetical protein